MTKIKISTSVALTTLLLSTSALAASDKDIDLLRNEIQNIRNSYESRIAELEEKLSKLESKELVSQQNTDNSRVEEVVINNTSSNNSSSNNSSSERKIYGNEFNPSIGVILNGKFSSFSENTSELKGFGIGEEGERGSEGLAIDESELNFAAAIDDKFKGSMTAAIVREDGSDIVELEEAYVQTLSGSGLPNGLNIKAGRAFWTLGYMNELHSHSDDFADRALPYRAFLNNSFNDDGLELSYILPTTFYSEIGGGTFRGDDFPAGGSNGEGAGSYSTFARIGGDLGENQSWRLGASYLSSDVKARTSNEDNITFIGDSDLYITDLKYTWAPTGNSKNQEIILQGEYFLRNEDGAYNDIAFNGNSSGWYTQGVYKFHPQWRIGYRYTKLESPDTPAALLDTDLDSKGHDPYINSVMADWTNSEFSRIRFQYNNDNTVSEQTDNQFIMQYIMSLGAHGAHKY
jgi:hypothetical protein